MITQKDVHYIAGLSRIHVSEQEEERFAKNMEDILGYIKKLEEVDVSNVPPTSHVLNLENVYREDKAAKPLTQEEALSVSQHKHNGFFQVPKVIE